MGTRLIAFSVRLDDENEALALEEMRGAFRYYNRLIRLEREAWDKRVAASVEFDPILGEDFGELDEARKKEQTAARKRFNAAWKARPSAKAEKVSYFDAKRDEYNEARCFWGTRLKVIESVERATSMAAKSKGVHGYKRPSAPRYRSWHVHPDNSLGLPSDPGEGLLAVQLQGDVSWSMVRSDRSTYLAVDDPPARPPSYGDSKREVGNRWRKFFPVRFRIGSDGRTPVWLHLSAFMDRVIPGDCRVTWATLGRRRTGNRYRWTLYLSVEWPDPPAREVHGVLGLDVGYRKEGKDSIRAAAWCDPLGQTGTLSVDVRNFVKADRIDSRRTKRFNKVRAAAVRWFAKYQEWSTVPDYMTHLHQWKSQQRLARAAFEFWNAHLPTNQLEGDLPVETPLTRFAKFLMDYADREMADYDLSQHERRRGSNKRNTQFRMLLAKWRKSGWLVSIEKLSVAHLVKDTSGEAESSEAATGHRRTASRAAIGKLLEFVREGNFFVEVDAANSSKTCSKCGAMMQPGPAVNVTCPECDKVHDQDVNAAINLQRAGEIAHSEGLSVTGAPPKGESRWSKRKARSTDGDTQCETKS